VGGATGAAGGQLGLQAQALMSVLNERLGLSHGKIAWMFDRVFGLKIARFTSARSGVRTARRLAAVNGKVWSGNRTWLGARAQSVILSVIGTRIPRHIEALAFLAEALTSPTPALLAQPRHEAADNYDGASWRPPGKTAW
jgi:hypothetical protein